MTAWVRHGQSVWNAVGRLQGRTTHPPLTALGRRQSAEAAELLDGSRRLRRMYTSPAVRARQTADILTARLRLPIGLAPLVAEQGLGEPEAHVTDRLLAFVTGHDLDSAVVVSHGDTIQLAALLLTGIACPPPDNGGVVHLPARPPSPGVTATPFAAGLAP